MIIYEIAATIIVFTGGLVIAIWCVNSLLTGSAKHVIEIALFICFILFFIVCVKGLQQEIN